MLIGRKQICLCRRRGLSLKSWTPCICFYGLCCLFLSVIFVLYGQYLWLQHQPLQYAELRGMFTVENSNQLNAPGIKYPSKQYTNHIRVSSPDITGAIQLIDNSGQANVKEEKVTSAVTIADDNQAATTTPIATVIRHISETTRSTSEGVISANDNQATITTTTTVMQNISETARSPSEAMVSRTVTVPRSNKQIANGGITQTFDSILQGTTSPESEAKSKAKQELQEKRAKMMQELQAKKAKLIQEAAERRRVATMLKSLNLTGLRALVENLQNKFDNDDIISVRGFYSSGTNWLRSLFRHNCKNMTFERSMHPPMEINDILDADGVYGWKHGLFLKREITRLSLRKRHRLVIISREAPTWVISAWKMFAMVNTPEAKRKQQTSQPNTGGPATGAFGNFSRYMNDHKVRETCIHSRFLEMYYDTQYREQYRIEADNVLEARTKVYRNWMTLFRNDNLSNQVYFMRYEDLIPDPYSIFRQLLQSLNITTCTITSKETFDPANSYVKYQVEHKKHSFKGRHPRKEFCITINSQAIYEAILSNVDRAFDSEVLGYTYPDTLEEYCRGVLPPVDPLPNTTAIISK